MFLMILIDIIILVGIGIPIFLLHRRWHGWVGREPANDRPVPGRRRFGLRSWAARSFVLDKPVAHVKEQIDGLPEMLYPEAAAMIGIPRAHQQLHGVGPSDRQAGLRNRDPDRVAHT